MEGGKASRQGTPHGGVISPLVANLTMNRFLKHWRRSGKGEAWQAHIVNYADDFVSPADAFRDISPLRGLILSRGQAAEALAWTDRVMMRLGLSLNRTKTRLCDARRERFDFLGYSFGPHCFRQTGRWFIGASPSKKSVQRLKEKLAAILAPGNMGEWEEVREALNRLLRGWGGYFSPGSHYATDRVIEGYLYDRVRNFLVRRHKMPTHGYRHIRKDAVFGPMGVPHLRLCRKQGAFS
jgi:RNA-directed DNA polymerase